MPVQQSCESKPQNMNCMHKPVDLVEGIWTGKAQISMAKKNKHHSS